MNHEPPVTAEQVEQIFRAFDDAAARSDVEAALALFAEDATLESPAVQRLLKRKRGVCRGHQQLREFLHVMLRRKLPWGRHERPIVRGNTVALEFMGAPADDEPFSVDIVEIRDGKIQSLRAYLGWRALGAFAADEGT
jgi:ketosteroid isomerase-like protein